jgi:hypothetical protein
MRRQTPIHIVRGQVMCWQKLPVRTPVPVYALALPKLRMTVLSFPRRSKVIQIMDTPQ